MIPRDDRWHFSLERIIYRKVMELYNLIDKFFMRNEVYGHKINYKFVKITELEIAIDVIKQIFRKKFAEIEKFNF